MIAKSRRLTKGQIDYIQRKGEKFDSKLFIVKYSPSEEKAKYCLIISKKFASKAVERNKLRRQIFEIIRNNEPPTLQKNIVLIPKKTVSDKTFQEVEAELIEVLKKLNE